MSRFFHDVGSCCGDCSPKAFSGIGDLFTICTSSQCDDADRAMAQMRSVYASSPDPSRWRAAVDAIEASFAAADSTWGRWTDNACCNLASIGKQADALTVQMAPSSAPGLPGNTKPAGGLDQLQSTLATLALVLAVGGGIYLVARR